MSDDLRLGRRTSAQVFDVNQTEAPAALAKREALKPNPVVAAVKLEIEQVIGFDNGGALTPELTRADGNGGGAEVLCATDGDLR